MIKCLFFDAETAIVGLLGLGTQGYVCFDQLERLCDYIKQHTAGDLRAGHYDNIVLDVNPDSIWREVHLRPRLFDLEGERVYMICDRSELPSLEDADPYLMNLIFNFVQKEL